MSRVLMVEDDELFVEALKDFLRADGIEIVSATTIAAGEQLATTGRFDAVVMDQRLPDGSGLALAATIRAQDDSCPILLVTAFPELENVVEALRVGIRDYLSKPVDLVEFRRILLKALRETVLQRREEEVRKPASIAPGPPASSGEMMALAERVALSHTPVLIEGETGTGKTRLARWIHDRRDPELPFVELNCAALPDSLVEAELFGTEAGAFTGARERPGLFEEADGGTLFLDEIGEMPLHAQSKLLGVLDSQRIRRVGSTRDRPVSVRILAATNVPLSVAVQNREFRADLWYRLDVVHLRVPELRNRLDELPAILTSLLARLDPSGCIRIAQGEVAALCDYPWPGNIRELANVLERSLLFPKRGLAYPSAFLPTTYLPTTFPPTKYLPTIGEPDDRGRVPPTDASSIVAGASAGLTLEEVARGHVLDTLLACSGSRKDTAERLGIGVATLRRKLHQLRDNGYGAQIDQSGRSK